MSKTQEDTPAPNFLHPLHKRTRSPAVTAQLGEMGRLSRSAVLRRAADTDPAQRLKWETLVAIVRGYLRAGDTAGADTVLELLIERISRPLATKTSTWAKLTPEDKNDAQRQMMTQICEQVTTLGPAAEFWECNFTSCFQRRLITLWHSLTDHHLSTVPSVVQTQDGEAQDRLDQYPDPADALAEIELQDLIKWVSGGSAQKSKALFLRQSGFSEEEIAQRVGVTSRTLRNWAAEARDAWNGRDKT